MCGNISLYDTSVVTIFKLSTNVALTARVSSNNNKNNLYISLDQIFLRP